MENKNMRYAVNCFGSAAVLAIVLVVEMNPWYWVGALTLAGIIYMFDARKERD